MADVTPTTSAAPPSGDDWPAQAATTIVKVVGTVRDRTTGQAITASRAVVYGLLASLLGLCALVLFCVLTARLLTVALNEILSAVNWDRPGRGAWMADVVLVLGFGIAGAALWKRATGTPAD